MKTLMVDGQLWQTDAWYRGMGVYTRNLLTNYIKDADVKVLIVLNGNIETLPDRIKQIKQELQGAEIHYLDLPITALEDNRARRVLDDFIKLQSLDKSTDLNYIILSLFTFNFCANFPSYGKKILMQYDLIPLLYWDFFHNIFPPQLYFHRFTRFHQADIIIAISQTTARDMCSYLGLASEKVINIDGAIQRGQEQKSNKSSILKRLDIEGVQYVLMPTGDLPHKNAIRAVEAFADVTSILSRKVKLVATSFYGTSERKELSLLTSDIIFTGNIDESDMTILYKNCRAVLMPSLYEGLGIPVLEGIMYDKPVACADISVFREFPHYKDALYLFDPYKIESIYNSLYRALAEANFLKKKEYYQTILDKYNWQRSAKLFANALNELSVNSSASGLHNSKVIAVVCPDPRTDERVGQAAQKLWGYAKQKGIEVVYFIDSGGISQDEPAVYPDYIRQVARCYDIDDFYKIEHTENFQSILYFLSDQPRYSKVFLAALTIPGIAYINTLNYRYTFDYLAVHGLISQPQYISEQFIEDNIDKEVCNALSIIVNSKAIVAEAPQARGIELAIKLTESDAPFIVSKFDEYITNQTSISEQQYQYAQLLEFIEQPKNGTIK